MNQKSLNGISENTINTLVSILMMSITGVMMSCVVLIIFIVNMTELSGTPQGYYEPILYVGFLGISVLGCHVIHRIKTRNMFKSYTQFVLLSSVVSLLMFTIAFEIDEFYDDDFSGFKAAHMFNAFEIMFLSGLIYFIIRYPLWNINKKYQRERKLTSSTSKKNGGKN